MEIQEDGKALASSGGVRNRGLYNKEKPCQSASDLHSTGVCCSATRRSPTVGLDFRQC
jgi:hypothetical protein